MNASYGVMAEYRDLDGLLGAIDLMRECGYRHLDAYTPFPSEAVGHALGLKRSPLPWLVLSGGLVGAAAGYALQTWTSVAGYPLNVGGRPLHSWPYFVPVTFELGVLAAALTTVLGMLALNRLPTPYHPVFNNPAFRLASQEAFFLCVEASDPEFDAEAIAELLEETEPVNVAHVHD